MCQKPNFFIVGAPKCGTTSLSEYLRQHPNVFVSNPKEPNYFGQNLPPQFKCVNHEQEYLHLFKNTNPATIAIGEASVWYLYSKSALNDIKEFAPDAKIIVMLRNPSEIIPALHSDFVRGFTDKNKKLEHSWAKIPERKLHYAQNSAAYKDFILCYDEIAMLGRQLDYLLTIFPRKQVHIIFFEDFISKTNKTYNEVLKFLNVPEFTLSEYKQYNKNKIYRSNILGKLLSPKNPTLLTFTKKTKKLLGLERTPSLFNTLNKFNMKHEKRAKPSALMSKLMLEAFTDDIKLLSEISGRDLSSWLS